jgi:hypothetical protein
MQAMTQVLDMQGFEAVLGYEAVLSLKSHFPSVHWEPE